MANSKCRWDCPEQWSEWSEWLAAGLHARNRWRLPVLLTGILFASGRRTVTTWLRAAGVSDDFQDYYYFLTCVGRKSESDCNSTGSTFAANVALARAGAAGDRRFAHQAVWAEGRRGGCPSQPDARPGRPAISVRTCLGNDLAGSEASRSGGHWHCRCEPCCMFASGPWQRFPSRVTGNGLPPSSSWRPDWWSGSFRC